MKRRSFLGGAAGVAAALSTKIAIAQPTRARTLRLVPVTALTVLDTVFSTSLVTTSHGWTVYDTLFGINSKGEIKPQMAEGYTVSDDGRTYVIRLREGLKFHNGEPVRAQDCIQSLIRWSSRESVGQTAAKFVDSWGVGDDRSLKITLKRPAPIFLEAIARGSASIPFIMPEYVAKTDPYKQITETIGSGPYRFVENEYVPGSIAVYARNADYVPRQEPADLTSGGKVPHFERLEWPTIPDSATAAAALQSGEVDWYEQVQPDLVPLLRRNADIMIGNANPSLFNGILRFNHLQPPFNNPAIRRAVLLGVNQHDYMVAVTGNDSSAYRDCKAALPCGTTDGRELGAPFMPGDLARARAALKEAGYNGEKVVVISPADVPTIGPFGEITHDLLVKMGMNSDLVSTDWATVASRRANRESVEKGGWSIFHTWAPSSIISTPVESFPMRGLGAAGWAGWYGDEKMEELIQAWVLANGPEERGAAADAVQRRAFEMVPFINVGQFQIRSAYRKNLTGIIEGTGAFMWNVRRA
jgi:peptide/nickel transport system substrate-binding protein